MNDLIVVSEYCLTQFQQIGPYWIIGLFIGSIISVFCKEHISIAVEKINHKQWGVASIIPAAFLGILSPLCMYGTIPVVAAMSRRKIPEDWLTSFMVCSILLNPQLLIYTLALGAPVALMRFAVCFIAGIVAGLLVRFFFHNVSFYKFIQFDEQINRDTDPHLFMRLLKNIGRSLKITVPYFAVGIILPALYQVYFPQNIARNIFTWNPGFGVLFAAALGVPFYACGGGNIPLLAAWLDAGMTSGSAAAFMITGQAIKMTNLSAVKIILGARHFALYIAFTIIFAITTGLVINIFREFL
jgi:uncharacterized membrane protein YraQ (UPF0718 family)